MRYLIFAILFSIIPNISYGHSSQTQKDTYPVEEEGSYKSKDFYPVEEEGSYKFKVKKRASDYELQYRFEQLRTRSLINDRFFKQRFQDIMHQLPFLGGRSYSFNHTTSSPGWGEKKASENNYLEYALSKFIEESDRADKSMEYRLRDIGDLLFSILEYIEQVHLDPGVSFDRPDYYHHPKKHLPFCDKEGRIAIEDKLYCIEDISDQRDFYIDQRLTYLERIWPTVKKYIKDLNIEMSLNPSLWGGRIENKPDYDFKWKEPPTSPGKDHGKFQENYKKNQTGESSYYYPDEESSDDHTPTNPTKSPTRDKYSRRYSEKYEGWHNDCKGQVYSRPGTSSSTLTPYTGPGCGESNDCALICEDIFSSRSDREECYEYPPENVRNIELLLEKVKNGELEDEFSLKCLLDIDDRPIISAFRTLSSMEARNLLKNIAADDTLAEVLADEDDLHGVLKRLLFKMGNAKQAQTEVFTKVVGDKIPLITLFSSSSEAAFQWIDNYINSICVGDECPLNLYCKAFLALGHLQKEEFITKGYQFAYTYRDKIEAVSTDDGVYFAFKSEGKNNFEDYCKNITGHNQ